MGGCVWVFIGDMGVGFVCLAGGQIREWWRGVCVMRMSDGRCYWWGIEAKKKACFLLKFEDEDEK